MNFLTPHQRRSGLSEQILQKRHEVYEAAKAAHSERWNGRETRNWSLLERVYLNPDRELEQTNKSEAKEADAS